MRTRALAAAVVAITLLGAGCGDDGDDTADTGPQTAMSAPATSAPATSVAAFPPTEDGLRDAATAQTEALIAGSEAAYDFLSATCKREVSRIEWAYELEVAAGIAESVLGFPLADTTVGNVQVRNVDGQRGEAAVETLDPEGYVLDGTDDFVEYVYEDGSWRINDCAGLGGGGSDTTGSDTSD